MKHKTTVIVNLQVEGIHCWPQAKEIYSDIAFLSDPHRHMFHITCEKEVNHNDRDVEFIRFKREINSFLLSKYADIDGTDTCKFGSMSCEMLATELLDRLELESCIVMEDGENGSKVIK